MKRKIFSKLLMVALVIAAVGSFVSCKDYDDDINNLQKQIDAKAAISELTALQSTLDSKIAAAKSAADAAQAKADAAATKTSVDELKKALETAIADAKKAGTDAGTKAGEAITAANKAQETADAAAAAAKKADEDAKAALADALKTIEETYQTKADAEKAVAGLSAAIAAVKETADAAFTKAEAEKLQEQVDGLKAELEAAIDEKIDAKIQEVNNAVASVDAIWKAVTSVELVPSSYNYPGTNSTLNLLTGTEVQNKFGADASPAGDPVRNYGAADKGEIAPVDYTAGEEISFDNRIVVRVNPANAELKKEDITLINSLGESLDEYVEVKNIADYNQLITRADVNTGLKVITFARKAGVTNDELAEATQGAKVTTKSPNKKQGLAVYAIGVKSGEDDRVLYSTFDLDVWYGPYSPVTTLNFEVKGDAENQVWTKIADLKNRWNNTEKKVIGEDKTKESPVADKWYAELNWQNLDDKDIKAVARYTVDTLTANKKANYISGDDRTAATKKYVVVDEDTRSFDISLSRWNAGAMTFANNSNVQYYYVVLDKFAAVESAPSEFEAWSSYKITGLNEITPATDPLKITIESESAIGDIIGFRVIAVNYDGSLVDPDGRSFYVVVGTPSATDEKNIAGSFVARVKDGSAVAGWNNKTDVLKDAKETNILKRKYNSGLTPVAISDITAKKGALSKSNGTITIPVTDGVTLSAVKVNYWLLSKDDGTEATKVEDIKFILLSADKVGQMVNGQSGAVKDQINVTDADHHDALVAKLGISATKVMPTAPGFKWNATREPVNGVLTVYPAPVTSVTVPVVDWDVDPSNIAGGEFSIAQYTNIKSLTAPIDPSKFTFHATRTNDDDDEIDVIAAGRADQDQLFTRVAKYTSKTAAGEAILGTAYDAELTYLYDDIDLQYIDDAYVPAAGDGDYEASASDLTAIKFVDALDPSIQTYDWANYNFKTGKTYNATMGNADEVDTHTSNKYFIVWGDDKLLYYADASGADKRISDHTAVNAAIWTLLKSDNSANMAAGGYLLTQAKTSAAMIQAWYHTTGGGYFQPNNRYFRMKITAGGTEYYTAELPASGVWTDGVNNYKFKQATGVVPPASTLEGTIEIYAITAFGLNWNFATSGLVSDSDLKHIATLPFTLYHNAASVQENY